MKIFLYKKILLKKMDSKKQMEKCQPNKHLYSNYTEKSL